MKVINNTLRNWLLKNNYEDIALLIDEILEDWKKQGKGTRRNWWDKLAGGKNGKPCVVSGKEIPVLKAAQIRQGKPVTKNAICKNKNEIIPYIK
jgi:hypothetical protein